jgi:hypothetical protein
METNIHRHVDTAVTQLALDVFWMFALSNKKVGVGVS